MGPYFVVLFLNAFVDLGHKITIQNIIFKVESGATQIVLTALVNALILIPFVLLVVPAGRLSDRRPKRWVMEYSAAVAVGVTLWITLCYYQGWFEWAFFLTLILALQSAFFSPAKYGYLREQVSVADLTRANGMIQAVTIVAILGGMFLFSLWFERLYGVTEPEQNSSALQAVAPLGWWLVGLSLIEWWLARRLPPQQQPSAEVETPSIAQSGSDSTLSLLRENPIIWYAVIGLALFWGISQVSIAAFPALAKAELAVTNTLVIQGVLASAGLGILVGAVMVARLSRGWIETGLIPLGAIGVTVSLALIPLAESVWGMALLFLWMGLFGSLLIVPLNALIQLHAPAAQLGQVLAGNNWIQNSVMFLFLLGTMTLALVARPDSGHATLLFQGMALVALSATVIALRSMPQSLIRLFVRLLFRRRYQIHLSGLEQIPAQGGVLLLGNHISWIDWAMLQIVSARPIRFVMEQTLYEKPLWRGFLDLVGVIPISSQRSREALRRVRTALEQGEVVSLFPEGAISHNGQLRPFQRGFEIALRGTGAMVVPFYIQGLWGSRFSRSVVRQGSAMLRGGRRSVHIGFGAPFADTVTTATVVRAVEELSVAGWQAAADQQPSLAERWVRQAKRRGRQRVLSDALSGERFSGFRLLTAAAILCRRVRADKSRAPIGVLLPTTAAGIMTNLAVLMAGRTLVNLNYSAAPAAIVQAVEQAGIETIYSSERFLQRLGAVGEEITARLPGVRLIPLEAIRQEITTVERLATLLMVVLLPTPLLIRKVVVPSPRDQSAVILFSSGSEGRPKGVELSQRNLIGNISQIIAVLEPRLQRDGGDCILGSLPLFHAFGLTATTLLPLLEGIPLVVTPDPTDTVGVVRAIEQNRATLYIGTPTFIQWMSRNRRVQPAQLQSLRLVITGAERLKQEVRDAFEEKFGLPLYEGYGATETAPVSTVNVPDRIDSGGTLQQQGNQPGSVGRPLPGTRILVVDPDSLQPLATGEAGLVLVRGVQVMKGYLCKPEKGCPQPFVTLEDGTLWYRSGDKGAVDQQGFLTIVDRYSRFAKIGGEMVSLGAVETAVVALLSGEEPESEVVAVALEERRKGEKIVLLYCGSREPEQIQQQLRREMEVPLWIPSAVRAVEEIPLLGSGKRDYGLMKQWADI
ncbi:MAG: MFS transporter [Gammaproteobacteria bacterium]|nr:MFS transporter [Gammaproteobacteria bacterium]